ncbi:cobalamin-binding protein [Heliorestis acidaminivorans]|uniref:Cobalamin-binding protein n=1 Tax=Heliorestis acidaminivorans TaxID=553427 RepID=A0A6I0F1L2_9FIRM|nr:cobalamin-dependent protein [Heliorestis acidaminivorans]KAB2953335.1 cobalamin-binding protein [Heliorestis acidaminivorans]
MKDFHKSISKALDAQRSAVARELYKRQHNLDTELSRRFGQLSQERALEDFESHLAYLSEAIRANQPMLFLDHIAWLKSLLEGMKVPAEDLSAHLDLILSVLMGYLPEKAKAVPTHFIQLAQRQLPNMPAQLNPFIDDGDEYEEWNELASNYLQALLDADREKALMLIEEAFQRGVTIKDIYLKVFQRTQYEIGRLWQINRLSVAQEHYCTAATQLIMSQFYPKIFNNPRRTGYRMVATCVGGDLHEMGIRMVADFFEMEGWDTYYLGANMPIAGIISAIKEWNAHLLALSATMTFHVSTLAKVIEAVRSDQDCAKVKILVGGYPFNIAPDLWKEIGADGYAKDANEAIIMGEKILNCSSYS